ncbi:HisA/HisF-related TIM barrel protein [Phenylobacterium sp.]|uniref:HisA/HisF-related TIM barrel protein n=1 Tax=Phenylobacterium sp. TaxID=1871053 RepID=UPI002F948C3D
MLRSRIAPCLLMERGDLINTRKFQPWKYVGDPVNAVKIFNEKQVDELILLDVEASISGRSPDFDLLAEISAESRMPLCYGGGIKDVATAARLTSMGFEKISLSSAALERPALVREVAQEIGRQSVCVTLDVNKDLFGGYRLYTHRGKKAHKMSLKDALTAFGEVAGEIVINAIHRDGTMEGYDLDLAAQVRKATGGPLTFVGGAGSVDHFAALIDQVGTCGAAAGTFFVFNGKYHAVLLSYCRPEAAA